MDTESILEEKEQGEAEQHHNISVSDTSSSQQSSATSQSTGKVRRIMFLLSLRIAT